MSRKLVYEHVDVFTDKPFGGNQLAVFHSPGSLTKHQMQLIAREMNFSETTFVFPSRSPGVEAKVRIFTPGEEMPFAGHPVLGTAYVIYRRTKGRKPSAIVLEIGLGREDYACDRVTGTQYDWLRAQIVDSNLRRLSADNTDSAVVLHPESLPQIKIESGVGLNLDVR